MTRREPGGRALAGPGAWLKSRYGNDTMFVITPIAYDRLRRGKIIAYPSHTGVRVVHRLMKKLPGGWQVKGLNNEVVDR